MVARVYRCMTSGRTGNPRQMALRCGPFSYHSERPLTDLHRAASRSVKQTNGHCELTVTTVVTAPGPNDRGSVMARMVHYWFVSIFSSHFACCCWNYLYFLISAWFFIHPIQISLHTTVWPAGADQARQCLHKRHPLGGCLICSSDYLLMPAIQLTIWYSIPQKIAFYWCHTIYHLSDKFIIGL